MTDSSCERSMPLVTLLDLCNCIQVICACHPTPEQRIQRFALLLWVVQHRSLPNCFETLQTQMVRPLWDPLKKAPGFWDCPVSPFTSKPLPKEFCLESHPPFQILQKIRPLKFAVTATESHPHRPERSLRAIPLLYFDWLDTTSALSCEQMSPPPLKVPHHWLRLEGQPRLASGGLMHPGISLTREPHSA